MPLALHCTFNSTHNLAGFQYRQCLEYLDEMTDMGIAKNVIIFGAAMSCMEKCSRADIGFELLKRMRSDGVQPNVHIYNSLISACSRSGLWEKGYELYEEMGHMNLKRVSGLIVRNPSQLFY